VGPDLEDDEDAGALLKMAKDKMTLAMRVDGPAIAAAREKGGEKGRGKEGKAELPGWRWR